MPRKQAATSRSPLQAEGEVSCLPPRLYLTDREDERQNPANVDLQRLMAMASRFFEFVSFAAGQILVGKLLRLALIVIKLRDRILRLVPNSTCTLKSFSLPPRGISLQC
jgi:hypothetical protein